MLATLALVSLVAGPATFETYVIDIAYDGPVRLIVNGVRVEEPHGKRVNIEHFVVPGANHVLIEPAGDNRPTPVLAHVKLVLGRSDSRSWEKADGQVVGTLKRGGTVFTVPQSLREPLWRISSPLDYEDITYRAKIRELHTLLVSREVDKYLAQFAESYAETERLFPMVKADELRKRDAEVLRETLKKTPMTPLDEKALVTELEANQHVAVVMRKGARETLKIGDAPVLFKLIKIGGALRPYRAVLP